MAHGVVVWCRKRTIYNALNITSFFQCVVVWCRKRTIYNFEYHNAGISVVVVWCRKRTIYNYPPTAHAKRSLWFDVGNGRYTTQVLCNECLVGLWFDVGNGRGTPCEYRFSAMLWFDVGTDNTGCHSPPSDSTSGWQSGCDASYIYNKVYIRAQSRPLVHGRRKNGDWGIGGQCFFVTL